MPYSPATVSEFLADVRRSIDANLFFPVNRGKNISTLTSLGISWSHAKAEIYALSDSDYLSGPDVDRDRPASDYFWMFKKTINGQLIYIKIKVLYQTNQSVQVVSFHIDWT